MWGITAALERRGEELTLSLTGEGEAVVTLWMNPWEDNLFPLLPFDGGHAAIATYERLRSRNGARYRADVNKMIPVTTVVLGLLAFLLFAGLYLDITNPL